jgi:hypothetical protein
MSPKNIVQRAKEHNLDIIGITDHNSTRQCGIVKKEALKEGIAVFTGVEVTTQEEIHCLAFFENEIELLKFQDYIDQYLPDFKNNTDLFGYQIVVDENEDIVFEEDRLLISALNADIDAIESKVHELNGVFIPAHANKASNSLISQLGIIPRNLKADAYEITKHITQEGFISQNKLNPGTSILRNSDAHFLDQIAAITTIYEMESPDFTEFKLALNGLNGRKVVLQ